MTIRYVKNPEYDIDGIIADRKSVMNSDAIGKNIQSAKEQKCEAVVIDLDKEITKKGRDVTFNSVAKEIEYRSKDFSEGFICYIVYNGKAVKVGTEFLNKIELSVRKNSILSDLWKKFSQQGISIKFDWVPYDKKKSPRYEYSGD